MNFRSLATLSDRFSFPRAELLPHQESEAVCFMRILNFVITCFGRYLRSPRLPVFVFGGVLASMACACVMHNAAYTLIGLAWIWLHFNLILTGIHVKCLYSGDSKEFKYPVLGFIVMLSIIWIGAPLWMYFLIVCGSVISPYLSEALNHLGI